jgi:hypothetical protein
MKQRDGEERKLGNENRKGGNRETAEKVIIMEVGRNGKMG